MSPASKDSSPSEASRPLIVLLQGPVGPFFRKLRQSFVERGFDVLKINFNGGDLLFSPRTDAIDFKGSPADWSTWLEAFIAVRRPAAIVLFGDGRPYHSEALRVAAGHGISTWCLEEGYLRPDFITCERNGNNAHSPLRFESAERDRRDAPVAAPMRKSFAMMAACAASSAIAQAMLAKRFQGNVRHRQRPVAAECARWALSLLRKIMFYPANRATFHRIMKQRLRDFYVVALQVHDDLNLLNNGNGWTMQRLIDETIRSFANHAPAHQRLLFKAHPLDRGHLPYRKLVASAARLHGCETRVSIVDDGPIGPMINHSLGVITVNSTSGLLALRHGKPLLVLGNAFYSTAALKTLPPANPLQFHSFWRQPVAAHDDDVRPFLARMFRESLINGSFYSPAAGCVTADAIADRIQSELASDDLKTLLTLVSDHFRRTVKADDERLVG
jgi:capsular polysaccharide export protein